MKTTITKAVIKAAKPQDKIYFIWDVQMPGLGLRIRPSGSKSWIYKYRTLSGIQQFRTIGRAEGIHPEFARVEAAKTMLAARSGENPAAELKAKRQSKTMLDLAKAFREIHLPLVKEATAVAYDRTLRLHIEARFGNRRLDSLEIEDMQKWKAEMATQPYIFNKARTLLLMMLDYAIEWNWIKANVLRSRRFRKFKEQKRKRYMTAAEVERLGAALKKFGMQSDIRWRFSALITLLLITGCRFNEIALAKWEWIDFDAKTIHWPDTKTGEDIKVLPDCAIEILKKLFRLNPASPYVIAGALYGKPFQGEKKMWREICQMANITNLRIHDLRKSFASFALSDGLGIEVIAGLLRHSNAAITSERYAFLMQKDKQNAANQIATSILDRLDLTKV